MALKQEVLYRLLIAKDFLNKIRLSPTESIDQHTLARHILTAHDAAELAIASIAHNLGVLPTSGTKMFLMDYFDPIQKKVHPKDSVKGRDYFSQLNLIRVNIKHHGIFPDRKQCRRVGETTYDYVSEWCKQYLGVSLDDIDDSELISDRIVKEFFNHAKEELSRGNFKEVLENLALAMFKLFESNKALRNLNVGLPRAEDAIKLSSFGVQANDYLALQEFLPTIINDYKEETLTPKWKQNKYGHPANWRHDAAEFCLKTFVDVTLCIQEADFIPGAIEFDSVYEYKITALTDHVKIFQVYKNDFWSPLERKTVRTLKKGESISGLLLTEEASRAFVDALVMGEKHEPKISFFDRNEKFSGEVEADKVHVTCVPRDSKVIRELFPDLPEIKYEP